MDKTEQILRALERIHDDIFLLECRLDKTGIDDIEFELISIRQKVLEVESMIDVPVDQK